MQTPKLNEAIAKAKAEFPEILENRKVKIPTKSGREISFTYAELEEIAEAVVPVLSKYGLSTVSQLGFVGDKFGLITSLRHESGESIESFFPLPFSPDGEPKELGIKISYGRRYNINCLLDIVTVDPQNPEERKETVRKVAKEFYREAGLSKSPKPITKGEPSLLEVTGDSGVKDGVLISQQHDLYPAHKNIIQQIRAITGHDASWIIAQCRHYGHDRTGMMPPDELPKLIADMCADYAVMNGVIGDRALAHTSIQGAISFAKASGGDILPSVMEWLERHSLVKSS
ncbi:hypothetical protein NIES592_08070 [Fischerella major NIES-592]|uniref:ERF family protein n=1 Tax=Fischerella major NIES-592 TaxID=210994 RepID=A0A1U7H1G6_9CYAN|nr:ERF family protein [Fischerella major]OKH14823.1 hypothetical protein NIES592_08070 [Fischerella major NIES-592]